MVVLHISDRAAQNVTAARNYLRPIRKRGLNSTEKFFNEAIFAPRARCAVETCQK